MHSWAAAMTVCVVMPGCRNIQVLHKLLIYQITLPFLSHIATHMQQVWSLVHTIYFTLHRSDITLRPKAHRPHPNLFVNQNINFMYQLSHDGQSASDRPWNYYIKQNFSHWLINCYLLNFTVEDNRIFVFVVFRVSILVREKKESPFGPFLVFFSMRKAPTSISTEVRLKWILTHTWHCITFHPPKNRTE